MWRKTLLNYQRDSALLYTENLYLRGQMLEIAQNTPGAEQRFLLDEIYTLQRRCAALRGENGALQRELWLAESGLSARATNSVLHASTKHSKSNAESQSDPARPAAGSSSHPGASQNCDFDAEHGVCLNPGSSQHLCPTQSGEAAPAFEQDQLNAQNLLRSQARLHDEELRDEREIQHLELLASQKEADFRVACEHAAQKARVSQLERRNAELELQLSAGAEMCAASRLSAQWPDRTHSPPPAE